MQGGTFDPRTPRRSRRLKSLTLSAAGLLTALTLIVGGLTGLGQDMLPHDAWPTFDGRDDAGSVVLAPAEQRHHASVPQGAGAPLGKAAVPLLPSERADSDAGPAAPTDASTGGTAAPRERIVRADYEEPVGEQQDRDAAAKGFRASIDTDRDGLTDVKEERLGTDALSRDSDGDQLPDGWEARHGLNPTDIADADADADGDGLRNRTEFRVKSDPRVDDTDSNGKPDGDDDTDGDGVSNGVEDDLPAADPTVADAPKVPVVVTPPAATEPPAAPAPAPAPVAPEPAPAPAPAAPTPPATPNPAPAVAETPAPAASPALSSP